MERNQSASAGSAHGSALPPKENLSFEEYCNAPAFPQHIYVTLVGDPDVVEISPIHSGITRREYYTVKAMQGLCADKTVNSNAKDLALFASGMASAALHLFYDAL